MKIKWINIICFIACLFSIGFFNLFSEERLISDFENRTLEQFPEFSTSKLFSGEYFSGIEAWFADQFIMRDFFVQVSSTIKEYKGIPGGGEAQIIVQDGFNAFEKQAAVPYEETDDLFLSPAPTETPVLNSTDIPNQREEEKTEIPAITNQEELDFQPEENPDTIAENVKQQESAANDDNGRRIGKTLIYNNSAMAIFPFYEGSTAYYAKMLNDFQEKAGEEVKVYSLAAPTNIEFIDNEKYRTLSDSQKDAISYLNSLLKGVIPVDAYTPLSEHKDEYVYFRTDHHWTALGAYYAYTGFAKAAEFEPVPLETYETETIDDYLGSMYDMTSSSALKKNPDTITVYKPFVKNEYTIYYEGPIKMKTIDMSHANKKNKYRVFISGDRPLGIIKTDVDNGKKILVIKDSYGNAMVPFLLPHYEEVYVIDPRQYGKNAFSLIIENGIKEVLILNYVPILSEYGFTDLIIKIMEADAAKGT